MPANTTSLKFQEKLGYGLGDAASNFFFQAFNLILLYFYTDVFGLAPAAVGTMFLVTKIVDAISEFARRNHHSSVEILVYDCTDIIKNSHRLIHLAEKASSKINIRKLPGHLPPFNESLVIADNKGYLHNPQSDRYEGVVSFNDPTRCLELNKTFTDMWNLGEIEPYMRTVSS